VPFAVVKSTVTAHPRASDIVTVNVNALVPLLPSVSATSPIESVGSPRETSPYAVPQRPSSGGGEVCVPWLIACSL
jgi:hypothetical protein